MIALDVLRTVAILLVTHSHMDAFYPVPELATGGLLGNTLFFFVSGYGLQLSLGRRLVSFWPWYLRRAWRVYAPMWIALAILIPLVFRPESMGATLALLLVPREYWFLPTITALYVPAYFVMTRLEPLVVLRLVVGILGVYVLASLAVADPGRWNVEDSIPLKALFYFAVMTLGIYAAKARWVARPGDVLLAAGLTIAFFGYLLMLQMTEFFVLQAGANLLALAWATVLFRALSDEAVGDSLERRAGPAIHFLSAITLQMYLVQVPLVGHGELEALPFPMNVLLFWGLLVILAWGLALLTRALTGSPPGTGGDPT